MWQVTRAVAAITDELLWLMLSLFPLRVASASLMSSLLACPSPEYQVHGPVGHNPRKIGQQNGVWEYTVLRSRSSIHTDALVAQKDTRVQTQLPWSVFCHNLWRLDCGISVTNPYEMSKECVTSADRWREWPRVYPKLQWWHEGSLFL